MTYSSSMSTSRNRYARSQQNTVSYKQTKRVIGPVSNTIILIVLSCLLGLMYLSQVTKTNAFGYRIDSLDKQASQLKVEHEELEVASARLQSLDRVKNSEVAKSLVSVAPVATIQN